MMKIGSRSARVAQSLLQAIAQRALRPGDAIDVGDWCRQHRVSRTVVREALAELAGRGLVSTRPGIDTLVAEEARWQLLDPELMGALIEQSVERLNEAVALRQIMEPALAAEAARRASRTERLALLGALRRVASAVGSGGLPDRAPHDAALHTAIAHASGNQLMQSVDRGLEPVRRLNYTRLRRLEVLKPDGWPDSQSLLRLQTSLTLAIVRADALAAAQWASRLAELALASQRASEPAPIDLDGPDGPPTLCMPDPQERVSRTVWADTHATRPPTLRIPSLLELSDAHAARSASSVNATLLSASSRNTAAGSEPH